VRRDRKSWHASDLGDKKKKKEEECSYKRQKGREYCGVLKKKRSFFRMEPRKGGTKPAAMGPWVCAHIAEEGEGRVNNKEGERGKKKAGR